MQTQSRKAAKMNAAGLEAILSHLALSLTPRFSGVIVVPRWDGAVSTASDGLVAEGKAVETAKAQPRRFAPH